jgi:hypothetical protein
MRGRHSFLQDGQARPRVDRPSRASIALYPSDLILYGAAAGAKTVLDETSSTCGSRTSVHDNRGEQWLTLIFPFGLPLIVSLFTFRRL